MATGYDVGLSDGMSSTFDARRWKAGAAGRGEIARRNTSCEKLEYRVARINGGRSHDVEQGVAGVWIQTENAKKKRLLFRISGVRDRYAGE